jgi:hypothetical protein
VRFTRSILATAVGVLAPVFVAPALIASDATATVAAVKIVRLWTGYRDAASFIHLGREPTVDDEPGNAQVLRSQPDSRDGFYFTLRLRGDPVPDGKIVLQVIPPNAVEPRTLTFPFTTENQRRVLLLVGLTGSDWNQGEAMPLAWKFEIVSNAGTVLATEESFLWRKP